jgi:hypothetical protein
LSAEPTMQNPKPSEGFKPSAILQRSLTYYLMLESDCNSKRMDTFCRACNRFLQFSTMGFGLWLLQNGVWYLNEANKHGRQGRIAVMDCTERCVENL